jgi:hypothetical protein
LFLLLAILVSDAGLIQPTDSAIALFLHLHTPQIADWLCVCAHCLVSGAGHGHVAFLAYCMTIHVFHRHLIGFAARLRHKSLSLGFVLTASPVAHRTVGVDLRVHGFIAEVLSPVVVVGATVDVLRLD